MIFCDASILLAAEDADEVHHEASVRLIESGESLATLDLAIYEVVNVAIRRWGDADAAARLRDRVFAIEAYGRLARVDPELAELAARLAQEHGLSAYDAAYAAAARELDAPLASCDERDLVGRGLARLPAGFG